MLNPVTIAGVSVVAFAGNWLGYSANNTVQIYHAVGAHPRAGSPPSNDFMQMLGKSPRLSITRSHTEHKHGCRVRAPDTCPLPLPVWIMDNHSTTFDFEAADSGCNDPHIHEADIGSDTPNIYLVLLFVVVCATSLIISSVYDLIVACSHDANLAAICSAIKRLIELGGGDASDELKPGSEKGVSKQLQDLEKDQEYKTRFLTKVQEARKQDIVDSCGAFGTARRLEFSSSSPQSMHSAVENNDIRGALLYEHHTAKLGMELACAAVEQCRKNTLESSESRVYIEGLRKQMSQTQAELVARARADFTAGVSEMKRVHQEKCEFLNRVHETGLSCSMTLAEAVERFETKM